jgi:Uma2 family endonuclease
MAMSPTAVIKAPKLAETSAEMDEVGPAQLPSKRGEWTWEVALQFPRQGEWTEQQFLDLPDNRHIEFTDGVLEFLPMPTWIHAWIVDYFHDRLKAVVKSRNLGHTAASLAFVRVRSGKLREPDAVFVTFAQLPDPRQPATGAQLVMEVVSEGHKNRKRDLEQKRIEYAESNIPEYWIVDPETETITVLTLPTGKTEYAVHGEFKPGQQAASVLLPGFTIDVTACFAAGKGEA